MESEQNIYGVITQENIFYLIKVDEDNKNVSSFVGIYTARAIDLIYYQSLGFEKCVKQMVKM